MKQISKSQEKEAAADGKNEPMAKTARVDRKQNGEVEPLRSTAQKQPGTDEAAKQRRTKGG